MQSGMRLDEQIPRDTAPENWEDETTLVLGAPSIGKSHLLGSIDDVDRVSSLTAAMAAPEHAYVVLDDFYRAFQAAREETQVEFVDWLGEVEDICVSARPRSFDWLLDSEESALPEQVLDCFDRAYHLRYDPEQDRKRAIEDCIRIGGSGSDGLDRAIVEEHIDDVLAQREYEFESDALRDTLGTESYSATLVPGLVTYVSDQLSDANQAIVSGSVVETVTDLSREYFENAALTDLINISGVTDLFSAEGLNAVRDIATSTLEQAPDRNAMLDQTESVMSAGGAGALVPFLGPAAAGGGALALWLKLRQDDSPDQSEVFDVLAGEELTPTAQVELERELDLPPRTIDNFQRLTRGDTLDELLHFRNRVGDELDVIDADVARLESTIYERTSAAHNRVDDVETEVEDLEERFADHKDTIQSLEETLREIGGYEERLTRLEETLGTVESNAVAGDELSAFVSGAIQNATGRLSDLESTIRVDETRLLQTTDIQSEIPYYGSEDHDIVESVDGSDSGVVALRGPHGTGKSTAAMRACRRLAIRGYDVRLPYFDNSSAEFVERALESIEGPTVVFVFYKRGTSDDNVIRTERQLKLVLDWIERGICDAAILECREELYTSFSQLDSLIEDYRVSRHFTERDEIEFKPLEPNDQIIREVVDWVLDELEYKGDRDAVAEAAIELAEGNLEIAKIAARFAATEDQHLNDVATMDELVWEDIKDIFSDESVVDRGRPVGNIVFEYLSAIREARTDELEEILHGSITRSQLKTSAQYLSGYLGGGVRERVIESAEGGGGLPDWMQTGADDGPEDNGFEINLDDGDTWEVEPDIYAEVAFRRVGLGQAGSVDDPKFGDYLDDLESATNGERYVGLAENLALAYSKAEAWGANQLQEQVVRSAYRLLERAKTLDLDPETLGRVFDELVSERIPLDPGLLNEMLDTLVGGTIEGKFRFAQEDVFKIKQLSNLWVGHLEYGGQSATRELAALSVTMSDQFSINNDPAVFLSNVYSMSISKLADSYPDPTTDRVQGWFDELQTRATTTANSDDQPDDPDQFLENVYGMAITRLAGSYPDQTNKHVQAWLDELQTRATTTANSDDHDPGQFLENVYSMAIKQLADSYPDPTDERIQVWLDELQTRATTTANSDDQPDDSGQFLQNVYSMSISKLADSHPDPTDERVQAWLDELQTRATTTANSDDHDPGQFLENVYSMAIKQLADSYPDPTDERIQVWLDELQTRVTTTANSDDQSDDSCQFLENVYGMAIANLADSYSDPTTDRVQAWLDELQTRATTTANSNDHDRDTGYFLTNVYGRTISWVPRSYSGPTDQSLQDWLGELQTLATTAAQSDNHRLSTGYFLANLHSIAIFAIDEWDSNLTDKRVQAWLDELQTRATSIANSSDHDFGPGYLFANVYSIVTWRVSDSYSDPTNERAQAWLAELQTRATTAAHSDNHDIDPGQFLGYTYGWGLEKIYLSRNDENRHSWRSALVEVTLIQVQPELLPTTWSQLYEIFDCARFEPSEVFVDIISDALSVSSSSDNLDWISQFVATGLVELAEEECPDDSTLSHIESVIENRSTDPDALIKRVSERLDTMSDGTAVKWPYGDWE